MAEVDRLDSLSLFVVGCLGERANVFTTSLANIGPGEEIVIEIEYQDRVTYTDGRFSLRFPMVVAPRYTPPDVAPMAEAPSPRVHRAATAGGADRDLFGPVRHPDAGPGNAMILTVTLDPGLLAVTSWLPPITRTAPSVHRPGGDSILLFSRHR